MDVRQIQNWVAQHRILDAAHTNFKKAFQNYQTEYEEFHTIFPDFTESRLSTKLDGVSLKIMDWPGCNDLLIIVQLHIIYEDSYVGEYKVIYNEDGTTVDDSLLTYSL